jgi:hypothetical protein
MRTNSLPTCIIFQVKGNISKVYLYRDVEKKREPNLFYEKSRNSGPINLKMCINNLNTHGFQHIEYKILNLKTF